MVTCFAGLVLIVRLSDRFDVVPLQAETTKRLGEAVGVILMIDCCSRSRASVFGVAARLLKETSDGYEIQNLMLDANPASVYTKDAARLARWIRRTCTQHKLDLSKVSAVMADGAATEQAVARQLGVDGGRPPQRLRCYVHLLDLALGELHVSHELYCSAADAVVLCSDVIQLCLPYLLFKRTIPCCKNGLSLLQM